MTGTFSWDRNGQPSGSVGYYVKANGIQLNYSYHPAGQPEAENVELLLGFAYTACNYGGQRAWLVCPACQKRVGVVYNVGKYFQCRKCSQLNYESQHLDVYARQQVKSQKIRQKLGGDGLNFVFPDKPKGMHWWTYQNWYRKNAYCDMVAMEGAEITFRQLEKLVDRIGRRSKKHARLS